MHQLLTEPARVTHKVKIILEEPPKSVKYYAGFNSRSAQPVFTRHHWAATEFASVAEAQSCLRQLQLLEYSGLRVVE